MWDALEKTIDVLDRVMRFIDLVMHWRFHVCVLGGLALAFLAHRSIPDRSVADGVAIAFGILGFLVGLVWDWRSWTREA
jgi:hypothetical protein